jgi:hypothetical protein
MKAVGSNNRLNIVAQFDRHGAGQQTRRYFINKGGALEKDAVANLGETNTGDPDVLVDFAKWAIKNYPAKRYLLVIWNHGAGWDDTDVYHAARRDLGLKVVRRGGNTGDGTGQDTVSIRRMRTVSGEKFHRTLFRSTIKRALTTRGIAYDDNAKDFLDSIEMQEVLGRVHKAIGHKFDVLGLDACLMSMAEIGYQIRGHTDFTVGSEELEPGDGWPYDTILRALAKKPEMKPRDLAKTIVNRYMASYGAESDVTQSACDLAKCDALAAAIDRLGRALKAEINDTAVRAGIFNSRAQAQSYDTPEYVDLHDLCGLLALNCGSAPIKAACIATQKAITGVYVIASGARGDKVANSHGVSIYFPAQPSRDTTLMSPLYRRLDFTKKISWNDFLDAWLQSINRRPRRGVRR